MKAASGTVVSLFAIPGLVVQSPEAFAKLDFGFVAFFDKIAGKTWLFGEKVHFLLM